jgi:hypothetical protein
MSSKTRLAILGFGLIFTSALARTAKNDPFAGIAPQDRSVLEPAISRYTHDQMKHDWTDLWQIDEQDIDTKRDFLLKDDSPAVSREQYVERKEEAIASGGVPLMSSFELISVVPQSDGFLISGCAAAKRESFHFKGIVEFIAHVRNGKATFGSWRYKYLMPHSCSQTTDSPV